MSDILDYIILGIFIIGFILGFKDGFFKKIFSFVGFVLAVIASFIFSPKARVFFIDTFNLDPKLGVVLSFILIFFIVIIISKFIINIIRPKKSVLGFIDRTIGGFIGTFQMGLFLSGLLIFLSLFNFPNAKDRSNLIYYSFTYNLLPNTFGFIKKIYPESEIIFDIFKKLKEEILRTDERDI